MKRITKGELASKVTPHPLYANTFIKRFYGENAQEKAEKFISQNRNKYQTQLIFTDYGFAVEYKPLRKLMD